MSRGQRGAINMDMFKEGLERVKNLDNGLELVMRGGDTPSIYAYKDGQRIGILDLMSEEYIPHADDNLTASYVSVGSQHQKSGIAKEMYKFASELGNDIKASKIQLSGGKAMWDSFHRSGMAKDGMIPRKSLNSGMARGQKGAIDLDGVPIPEHLLKLFRKYDDAANRPHVSDDPYLATTGNKAAKTRAFNQFYREAEKLGLNPGRVMQAITNETLGLNKPVDVDLNQGMGRKEKGAFLFGGDSQEKAKLDALHVKLKSETQFPDNPNVEAGLVQARTEPDIAWKASKNLESGSTLAAMNRRSTAVQMASRLWQNAEKKADLAIREFIIKKVDKSLRALDKDAIETLSKVMKMEATGNKRFDGAVLEKHLDAEQLVAYTHIREMFDAALKAQNEARALKGKKPITEHEAYMSSRWGGDFRMPIHDADGKLVWYLAADSRFGLGRQLAALKREFPALKAGEVKVVKAGKAKQGLGEAFSDILDVLGRDDPAIAKIQEAVEKHAQFEGELFRGQTKHHKTKAGVRGYIGDRPGKNPKAEAMAYLSSQVDYAKNAFQWAEFQKAVDEVKKITSDPELLQNQPKNVEYIRDLSRNYLGINEFQAIRNMENGIRDMLGVSPSVIGKAVGGMKTMFLLQKLAVSAGYLTSNVVQVANVIPHLMDLRHQGYKGNPATALVAGITNGMLMAGSHYLSKYRVDYLGDIKRGPNAEFLMSAFKYAEDNGVTARSIYDESPFDSRGVVSRGVDLASKTMIIPEVLVRSTAFMTYAQMLKESGKFGKDYKALFQKAEETVNASMVDYRSGERPMIFGKMGIAGNALNTLQTYPMNFWNQWRYFGKEAARGNFGPALTALLIQYGVAGAAGIPGFNDMDKLWSFIKEQLPDSAWMKVKDIDPKLWLMENLGDSSVYGALSEQLGIGITSRVTAPSPIDMAGSPVAPATDLWKQAGNVASLVADPTNSTKQAQALYDSTPVGLQGALEVGPLRDELSVERKDGTRVYRKASDMMDREGKFARTERDESIRRWGLRSQNEVKESDMNYKKKRAQAEVQDRITTIPERLYDAVRRGDGDKTKELARIYMQLTGAKGDAVKQMLNQRLIKEYTTAKERSNLKSSPVEIMKMQKRIQEAFEND
jgi:hypothetical protein